ncbi:hypothetical protein [Thermococcus siculi]|uniref:hypothetical protein n=1 Tax=Thermococcus siculi TaxID=72803 RepID=UPI001E37A61E|nr:hypothetical protein [Thermococcus siculi]
MAIEVLFITAVILTGVLLVVTPYLNENTNTSLIAYVKSSASHACSYLNSGVTVNSQPYSLLNAIIVKSNYTSKNFMVSSITSSESDDTITINVQVRYSGRIDLDNDVMALAFKAFLIRDLLDHTDARLEGTSLYYGDKKVVINVQVVGP